MTLIDELRQLKEQVAAIEKNGDETARAVARHDEQINGERGISAAINANTLEVGKLRKAAYWVAGLIVAGSISFAFGVLVLIPPG